MNASAAERNTSTEAGYSRTSILIRPQSDGGASATVTLGGSHVANTYLVASGDPDYVVGSDTYRIDEAIGNPAGGDLQAAGRFCRRVQRHSDWPVDRRIDVANTTEPSPCVAPVAKALTITKVDGIAW